MEKLVGKGGPRFWFKEKPEPQQQPPEGEGGEESVTEDDPVTVDDSATEDDPVTEELASEMSEDDPDEVET